ncbi:SDR family oxidoreductase [Niabella sp.]|uniref:SDR family NAD(P)-dependent oxidoreductase n=1 Tax=Niabella sp. TaxID=1962976 RepID=UPI0026296898|nr:SDR family oxidoreductase [Niabella sp.]
MNSMNEKVALVTGAAQGIGLASARAFSEAGAHVILTDITEPKAQARQLQDEGYSATAMRCDVTNEKAVKELIEYIASSFGRLDAAFNNAGINSPVAETADASGEEYDRVMAINLRGVWNCMKYELQQMRKQGNGAIVNCSSIGGLIGIAERGVYHASKHGVIGLTKSAALEYAARGININAVCPGIISTPMVEEMLAREPLAMQELINELPNKRLGRPAEVANVVLWLCSPSASLVVGQAIAVDGGYTVK